MKFWHERCQDFFLGKPAVQMKKLRNYVISLCAETTESERAMAVFWNCRSVLPRVMMSVH